MNLTLSYLGLDTIQLQIVNYNKIAFCYNFIMSELENYEKTS